MTYHQQTQSLIALGVPEDQIFDFTGTPHEHEFAEIFAFYKETIATHPLVVGKTVHLFFVNNFSVNAKAGKIGDEYVIAIHSGLVIDSLQKIKAQTGLEVGTEIEFLKDGYTPPLSHVLHELSMHLTFYHEFGHIIQDSALLGTEIPEIDPGTHAYIEERHMLEMDADEYSALCCAEHLMQSMSQIFNPIDRKLIEAYVVLGASLIFMRIMQFSGAKKQLHLFEGTHPHPAIRLTNVVAVMTHYVNQMPVALAAKVTLNTANIINRTLNLIGELEPKLDNLEPCAENYAAFVQQAGSRELINQYMGVWLARRQTRTDLSVFKRNQAILSST